MSARVAGVTSVALCMVLACWFGAADASVPAPPPPNDNYLASTRILQVETTGTRHTVFDDILQDTSAATTQPDLFNPDSSGLPFAGGGPEPQTCAGTTYGKTVWYDMHPNVPGGVEIVATGYTTAIAVFHYNAQTAQLIRGSGLCQVSGGSVLNDFPLPVELQAHKAYTFQVGGLANSAGVFDSGRLEVNVTFFPDHDGDGVYDELDHCPFLPGVRRFGGCPPAISPTPRFDDIPGPQSTKLVLLRLDRIPGNARVEARCGACRVRQVTKSQPHSTSVTLSGLAGLTLPLGAKLEIWVTKSATRKKGDDYQYGAIGSYISYTVGSGGLSSRVIRCLMPGSMTPRLQCPPPGGRR